MNDWDLVLRIVNGEREAYALLVDKYKKAIFNLAYKYTHDYPQAQDLSQEIFIHCYLRLEKFDNRSKFSTWLYRLAIHKCIDWQRKKKREPLLVELDEFQSINKGKSPEEIFIKKENALWLKKALNNLPEKYREVLFLYHNQGLSYKDISEILGIPRKTVETRIYRGKKLLKEQLSNEQEGIGNELSPYGV
ncbi:MAG: RNA polymerase sigma factor [Peptococcales bacterium]